MVPIGDVRGRNSCVPAHPVAVDVAVSRQAASPLHSEAAKDVECHGVQTPHGTYGLVPKGVYGLAPPVFWACG